MARAKRTARAEARRRYRAANPTETFETEDEATEDERPAPTTAKRASGQPAKATSAPPERVGMAAAFRLAFRPFRPADDIRAFPQVALHSNALWIPVLITVASTAAIAIVGSSNVLTSFMFLYFVQTPAIGGVFIAGFLAPRASWLLGAIVGLVAALCFTVLVYVFPSAIATVVPTAAEAQAAAVGAFILSPLSGAFFAAGAAWYRRFLAMSNPNRGRPSKGQPTKRSGDGKTRAGTSQKAGVRR